MSICYSVPDVRFTCVEVNIMMINLINQGGYIDGSALAEGFVVVCGCFEKCGGRDVGGVNGTFGQEIVVGIEPSHVKSTGIGNKSGHTRSAQRFTAHGRCCRQRIFDDVDGHWVAFAVAIICSGIVGGAAADILHLISVALSFIVHLAVVPFNIGSGGGGGTENHVDVTIGAYRIRSGNDRRQRFLI